MIREFFQVDGEYAMRNLTVFITIVVASFVVVYLAIMATLTEGIFIGYLLAGGGVYSFGKWQDDKTKRSEIDAEVAPATIISDHTKVQTETGNINVDTVKKKGRKK